ncbi:hypothetical protein OPV22_006643 [Ensete ventricosum]|uniref:Uncharacterized protein n=1 Tax=Ensete ventricosum TaxID=4639 RepID=A0AAV8RLR9_ENSVE|nr:hypothetical protein OPV22_006643 [Ensete ventricosum]
MSLQALRPLRQPRPPYSRNTAPSTTLNHRLLRHEYTLLPAFNFRSSVISPCDPSRVSVSITCLWIIPANRTLVISCVAWLSLSCGLSSALIDFVPLN